MTEGFAQPLRLIPNVLKFTQVHDLLWGSGVLIYTQMPVIITNSVSFPHQDAPLAECQRRNRQNHIILSRWQ